MGKGKQKVHELSLASFAAKYVRKTPTTALINFNIIHAMTIDAFNHQFKKKEKKNGNMQSFFFKD